MPHPIKLHNTLSGQKETFTPQTEGHVNLYCCGPTVYDYAHIGNFRSFLMADLLTRVLQYAGYKVTKVQNITDVGHLTNDDLADAGGDDKIAKKAKAEGKTAWDIAEFYTQAFEEDEKILRIKAPDHRPRATDFIAEQIAMTKTLMDKGYAYEANGSVYFRTAKFKDYGALSKNKLEDLQAGARVEVNDEKEDPLDFALWKHADQSHLMQWDFHTGEPLDPATGQPETGLGASAVTSRPVSTSPGFPGWHIECSAMSQSLLPEGTDIHTGGEDNAFPHHECEIAQNQCSHGYDIPMWLHAKHLLVDGKKMSKSKGNFYTIRDLLAQGWSGTEIRLALLNANYRTALNFTQDSLAEARSRIKKLQESIRLLEDYMTTAWKNEEEGDIHWIKEIRENYQEALFDDLNAPLALHYVSEMRREAIKRKDANNLKLNEVSAVLNFFLSDFYTIFEVLPEYDPSQEIPEEITILLQKRQKARENKDFTKSDQLRDEIRSLGWEVKDEAGGQSVSPL